MALRLPVAAGLPGTDKITIAVALDKNGHFYFENKSVEEAELRTRLLQAASKSTQPLALLVHFDKAVTSEQLIHLALLAREAGIPEAWLATLPGPVPAANPVP